jgi:uncharacterized RDD family membrane protein YckC
MLYEGILLFGVVFIPAYLFSALLQFKDNQDSPLRHVFQAYIFAAIGLYFVICWRRTGQTLPMKTWKFKLFTSDGGKPSAARAWLRYGLAWIGPFLSVLVYRMVVELTGAASAHFSPPAFWSALPFFLLNWLWAGVDHERQFLHDRLAGTRLLSVA